MLKKKLPEEVYRHFYNQGCISNKEMAYLICDKDPRKEKLTDSNSNFKKIKQRIYQAVKDKKIPFSGKYSVNAPIDCNDLFLWASVHFEDFSQKLPNDMVMNHAYANLVLLELSLDAEGFNDLPETLEDSITLIKQLYRENQKIKQENARISELLNKKKARIKGSSKGGSNSKGVNKTYK